MGTLTFVGLGLDEGGRDLTLSAIETIKSSDFVYFEAYTSPFNDAVTSKIKELTGKNVEQVSREFVEDGKQIIEAVMRENIVLISPGDPMIATTHTELRIRAEEIGIATRIIHNASIFTSLPGEIGLHTYKLGKTVTFTTEVNSAIPVVYQTVHDNLIRGLHTIILLEYNYVRKSSVDPIQALKALTKAEEDFKQGIFTEDSFMVVASRIGRSDQELSGGLIQTLLKEEFGQHPHALVIPGELHFTEKDALKSLLKLSDEKMIGKSMRAKRLSAIMVEKYVSNTLIALEGARIRLRGKDVRYAELLENVECYASDAKRFLDQGRDELAVLSIGYAEGLLDSLRFTKVLDVEW